VYDLTAPRNPEDALTARVRRDLQRRLPAAAVESNVPVVDSTTGQLLTDVDVLVVGRAIVLLKNGNGSGQLAEAELFLPALRDGTPNPLLPETNPGNLPVVAYASRLGPHAAAGMRAAGIEVFGGGRTRAERDAEYGRLLDHLQNLP
jgi:hypothetical protein